MEGFDCSSLPCSGYNIHSLLFFFPFNSLCSCYSLGVGHSRNLDSWDNEDTGYGFESDEYPHPLYGGDPRRNLRRTHYFLVYEPDLQWKPNYWFYRSKESS